MTRETIAVRKTPAGTGRTMPLALDLRPETATTFMLDRNLPIEMERITNGKFPLILADKAPIARDAEASEVLPPIPGWAIILARLANAEMARPIIVAPNVARPRL
jgi:hypothetical protein